MAQSKVKKSVEITRTATRPTTEAKIYRGICAVCKDESHCTYLRVAGQTPVQCEDFKGYPSLPIRVDFKRAPAAPKAGLPVAADPVEYRGLCKSCDNRATCAISRPDGGIWRCEEYI